MNLQNWEEMREYIQVPQYYLIINSYSLEIVSVHIYELSHMSWFPVKQDLIPGDFSKNGSTQLPHPSPVPSHLAYC